MSKFGIESPNNSKTDIITKTFDLLGVKVKDKVPRLEDNSYSHGSIEKPNPRT